MIDIRLIREEPERVKAAIATLNTTAPIDQILHLDEQLRSTLTEVEGLKAERNQGSKAVNQAKDPETRQTLIDDMRQLGDRIDYLDERVRGLEGELRHLLLEVPNIPDPDVPIGPDETHNVVVSEHGEKPSFGFAPKPHWDLAEELGIIDFERGVKVSGSRFYLLKGDGARLQRALITWMLDLHTQEHGYTEIYPPYLVLGDMLVGSGDLPKFEDALFRDIKEDKWLIPTAEVPLTNMYRDEILEESVLPIYLVGYTACFRREQISAGKDVRGIKRGYQFDKVEMVKLVHPDHSVEELDRLLVESSAVLERLELPYRVLQMCTGDLSFKAANKLDLETWAPASSEWLEVSSCSNMREFQARRANLRFRPEEGRRPQFVHTLNGSGLALPRTMISIMENYQQADGTIAVPKVLQPYLGGQDRIGKQRWA